MLTFDASDGPELEQGGQKMMKKKNPVYMNSVADEFKVETNEGSLTAHDGDYVAYDPISGHIWPVAASYVEQHYEPWQN